MMSQIKKTLFLFSILLISFDAVDMQTKTGEKVKLHFYN